MLLKLAHHAPDVFFYHLLPNLTIREINELILTSNIFKEILQTEKFWNYRIRNQLALLPKAHKNNDATAFIKVQKCKLLEYLYHFGKAFSLDCPENRSFFLQNLFDIDAPTPLLSTGVPIRIASSTRSNSSASSTSSDFNSC